MEGGHTKTVLQIESGFGWNCKEAEITVVLTSRTQKDGANDLFDLAFKVGRSNMGQTCSACEVTCGMMWGCRKPGCVQGVPGRRLDCGTKAEKENEPTLKTE